MSTSQATNFNNEHKLQKMYQPIKQRNLRLYQPIKQRIKIKNIYQTIIQQLKFKSREKVTTELTLIKRKTINQSIFNHSIYQSFNQSNKQQNHSIHSMTSQNGLNIFPNQPLKYILKIYNYSKTESNVLLKTYHLFKQSNKKLNNQSCNENILNWFK